MREIKFRVQTPDAKWHYYTLGDFACCTPMQPEYKSDTWCQYTGLKDRNGVEIYEGDVVRIWNGNKATITHDGFQFCVGKSMRKMEKIEAQSVTVLGNIYENPELIE